jgi:hypothetical protein
VIIYPGGESLRGKRSYMDNSDKMNHLIHNCPGKCKECKDINMCKDVLGKNDKKISTLEDYKKTGLEPDEVEKMKKELDYWKREAIRNAAMLGEIHIMTEKVKREVSV